MCLDVALALCLHQRPGDPPLCRASPTCFSLTHPNGRTYWLGAETLEEKAVWIDAIQFAINKKQGVLLIKLPTAKEELPQVGYICPDCKVPRKNKTRQGRAVAVSISISVCPYGTLKYKTRQNKTMQHKTRQGKTKNKARQKTRWTLVYNFFFRRSLLWSLVLRLSRGSCCAIIRLAVIPSKTLIWLNPPVLVRTFPGVGVGAF
jgi:hypothetical protein